MFCHFEKIIYFIISYQIFHELTNIKSNAKSQQATSENCKAKPGAFRNCAELAPKTPRTNGMETPKIMIQHLSRIMMDL